MKYCFVKTVNLGVLAFERRPGRQEFPDTNARSLLTSSFRIRIQAHRLRSAVVQEMAAAYVPGRVILGTDRPRCRYKYMDLKGSRESQRSQHLVCERIHHHVFSADSTLPPI